MPIDVVSKADGLRKSFFRSNRVIVSLFLVLWAIAVLYNSVLSASWPEKKDVLFWVY